MFALMTGTRWVYELHIIRTHYMDKTTLLSTDYTYPVMRPWARSFSADANAKGGLKLCSYWVRREYLRGRKFHMLIFINGGMLLHLIQIQWYL